MANEEIADVVQENIVEIMGMKIDVSRIQNDHLKSIVQRRVIPRFEFYRDHSQYNEEKKWREYSDHREKYAEHSEHTEHSQYDDWYDSNPYDQS
jgi:hypothetical protein